MTKAVESASYKLRTVIYLSRMASIGTKLCENTFFQQIFGLRIQWSIYKLIYRLTYLIQGPIGVRLGSARIRSGFVRDPFGVRAGSVRGPFGLRSRAVRGSLGPRLGSESRRSQKKTAAREGLRGARGGSPPLPTVPIGVPE